MKKKTFIFIVLLSMMIFVGNIVTGQTFEVIWNVDETANGGGWKHYYRGISYQNEHLYQAGTLGSSIFEQDEQYVKVYDAETGIVLDTLDNTGITPYGYGLRVVQTSEDGSILAANMTLDASAGHPFVIWRWSDETATPDSLTAFQTTGRIDMFTVLGDVSGDASIMAAVNSVANVTRRIVNGGVIGDETVIALSDLPSIGSISNVTPVGTNATDGFWYNNTNVNPMLYNADGTLVGAIPDILFTDGTTGAMKTFTYNAKDYLMVADSGGAKLIDITGKQPQDLTIEDIAFFDTTGIVSNIYQDIDFTLGIDGTLSMFVFSEANYIRAYIMQAFEAAPFVTDLSLNGYAMVDSTISVTYTYNDNNNDPEGETEIKWYLSDDETGTNQTEITGNYGQASYLCMAEDFGKFISVTILPVAESGILSDPNNLVETSLVEITTEANAPEAQNLTLTGDPHVFSTLTAAYDFYDQDGDEEGESILKWWRADDVAGTNAVEIATDTLIYDVVEEDTAKYIIFSVIPVSVSPNMSTGDSLAVATETAVIFPDFAPVASDVEITGIEEVSRELTGTYVYSDLNEDPEGESVLTWYRADTPDGTKTQIVNGTNIYVLTSAEEGKYVFFGVTPVSDDGNSGTEVFDTTGVIAPEPVQSAPVASDVVLSGTPEEGILLSAVYTYFDYTEDLEGESIYKWYIADDEAGTNQTLIENADKRTFLVGGDEIGKFIAFEVTPIAVSGGLIEGEPVLSNYTAAAAIVSTNNFGLERMWIGSTKTDALPWYLGAGSTERGIAVGSEHIYIASRNGGTRLMMINKENGSYVGELNTTGMTGSNVFEINDVEVSDDGQILAAPLMDGTEFFIYKWENESAEPVKWIETTLTDGMRLGDKFTVTGNVSEEAVIYAAASNTMSGKVLRWIIIDGVPSEAEIIDLIDFPADISVVAVQPVSLEPDANMLVDGKGIAPSLYTHDGVFIESFPMVDDYANYFIQSNSPNIFNYKGRTMAAFFQAMRQEPLGSRVIVLDITSSPSQIVDSSEYVSNLMPWNGYLGELDITVDDDYYHAFMMQTNNGIARFRGEMLLPEFASAETSLDGLELYADFTKSIDETTITGNEFWTIMSGDTELTINSITSSEETITFETSEPAIEGDIVTIAYNGNGTIMSFDGMPLAAFGPEEVLNLVGATVPEAQDINITGNLLIGQTVTGNYTYFDANGDQEGTSTFKWYDADDAIGSNQNTVIAATTNSLVLNNNFDGKYIAFEVTPMALTGGDDYLVGLPTISEWVGPIAHVGVDDVWKNNIIIYPNPVNANLFIKNAGEVQKIEVTNVLGKKVISIQNNNSSDITLNTKNLANGIYTITLYNKEGISKNSKFLKVD